MPFPDAPYTPRQEQVMQRLQRFHSYVFDAVDLQVGIEIYRRLLVSGGVVPEERSNPDLAENFAWVIDRGPLTVRRHAVIDYWAALEVFVEDIFSDVCAAVDLSG